MAATASIRLTFPGKLIGRKSEKQNGDILHMGYCSSGKTLSLSDQRILSLRTASTQRDVGILGTINGKKVNGQHVAEEAVTAAKLENENAAGTALVTSLHGNFVESKFVYRQIFVIRSYEIGPDQTATMETLMNFLQETALNHVTSSGIGGNGFGATREMSIRKLIWVVTRIQVQVQRYSSWGDVIEVDTWVDAAGKNGMRRDWIIRDHYTKEIITKATRSN